MKVYIAGPMRGYNHFNFPAFDEAAAEIRRLGWEVVSPAEHDRENGFDETLNTLEGFDLGTALLWDLEQILCVADTVVVLPGWSKSTGVNLELHAAEFAKKPVWYYHPDAKLRLKRHPMRMDEAA